MDRPSTIFPSRFHDGQRSVGAKTNGLQAVGSVRCRLQILSLCLGFWATLGTVPTWGLTPNSPEVKALIDTGVDWLDSHSSHNQLGGKALVAMVFLKAGRPDHPAIAEAVSACQAFASKEKKQIARVKEVYSLGLSIIFLCELDPIVHRSSIQALLEGLYERQALNRGTGQDGGFGYMNRGTGDTSMTQYAVLAMWTAHRSGIEVPGEHVKEVCEWLLRTQDPTGVWGYQGQAAGLGQRKRQKETSSSMAAAGTGSIYMLSDLLGLKLVVNAPIGNTEIPPALVPVPQDNAKPVKASGKGNLRSEVSQSARDGDKWLAGKIKSDPWPKGYPFYYYYALERYQSFRELATNSVDDSPEWYEIGVGEIKKQMEERGRWQGGCDRTVSTSFAVLFLMRGTKKTIQKSLGSGSGLLVGGRGLPSDVSQVRLQGGKLVNSSIRVPAVELLDLLETAESADLDEYIRNPSSIQIRGTAAEQSAQANRFRRLVRDEDHRIRRLAVQALAAHRDLDNVPYLIYAVTDPDHNVSSKAREGLRFISRNLLGVSANLSPKASEKEAIANQWKEWYRVINPDVRFLD